MNILLKNWAVECAKHGVALDEDHQWASWGSAMGGFGCSVHLELDADPRAQHAYMVPVVKIGSSSALPGDPAAALAQLERCRRVILKALDAHAKVRHLRVYVKGAPCSSCGGRGKSRGVSCQPCNGTGLIPDAETS